MKTKNTSIIGLSQKALIGLFLSFVTPNMHYAQKAENFNSDEMRQVLESTTTQVILSDNPQIDEKIKYAFNKYWTVSKFNFIDQATYNKMKRGKEGGTIFRFAEMESKDLRITFTKLDFDVALKNEQMYRMIEIQFDNMTGTKSGEKMGIDNQPSFVESKIVPYIMLMNTQLKKQKELGNRKYGGYNGDKNMLAGKTVLVQKEYFNEDIDSSLVKALPFKTRILPTDKIKPIIDAQKDLNTYAQLYFISTHRLIAAFIIDLQTGDLLDYAASEKMEPTTKAMNGKTYKKLVKGLSEDL